MIFCKASSGAIIPLLLLLTAAAAITKTAGAKKLHYRTGLDDNNILDRPYEIWDTELIHEVMLAWRDAYPGFARVETSQEAFGLDAAGGGPLGSSMGIGNGDCPFDEGVDGCYNYFVTIQDFGAHPEDSPSSNRLPEVLWSGALHGNERVGPTAVMEAANLLLLAASCEALATPGDIDSACGDDTALRDGDGEEEDDEDDPTRQRRNLRSQEDTTQRRRRSLKKKLLFTRFGKQGGGGEGLDDNEEEEDDDNSSRTQYCSCREELMRQGIDDAHRKWLAHMVSTRRLVVVPTANALGYYRNHRTEGLIDVNRDFPFEVLDPSLCMQTIGGRTLNEIFRRHMFQLSLTFHAGMEVIAFEWGSPTYYGNPSPLSPDHVAQDEIAKAYSRFGGSFSSSPRYATGSMNDLVYWVRGGMEDWAYAGSWDTGNVIPCRPTTFGGYDESRTVYNNGTLRVFNILVETSDRKTPLARNLGSSFGVMQPENSELNGHVSRNIRLALGSLDLVQPYIDIVGVDDTPLAYAGHDGDTVLVPRSDDPAATSQQVSIEWTVGGSLVIDETRLWYARWDDFFADGAGDFDRLTPEAMKEYFDATSDTTENVFRLANTTGPGEGTGFLHPESGPSPTDPSSSVRELGPIFRGVLEFDLEGDGSGADLAWEEDDRIIVLAVTVVDQNWKETPSDRPYQPGVPPQSHVVNARTNNEWHYESGNKVIQGQVEWFSTPITIVLGG